EREQRKTMLLHQIDSLEKLVMTDYGELNRGLANQLLKTYKEFYNANGQDSISGPYLFKAASIATSLGRSNEAIDMLSTYYDTFKTGSRRDEALYLMGFIYENHMHDNEKARDFYQRTVEIFPNSPWAEQAKGAMEMLNMSDEELIKYLEEKNNKN
ncbi:MAG: tetratricopeptide repeat protein, partial [Flavobacteriales bacterium]